MGQNPFLSQVVPGMYVKQSSQCLRKHHARPESPRGWITCRAVSWSLEPCEATSPRTIRQKLIRIMIPFVKLRKRSRKMVEYVFGKVFQLTDSFVSFSDFVCSRAASQSHRRVAELSRPTLTRSSEHGEGASINPIK